MRRIQKQLKKYTPWHSKSCLYPSEPCNCEVYNKSERRTTPFDPCPKTIARIKIAAKEGKEQEVYKAAGTA